MVRTGTSTIELIRELYEAQQKSMEALLEAWDRQLERHAAMLRANQQRQHQERIQATLRAAALESHLDGVLAQAMGGADVSVTLPVGVRVAGALVAAPNVAELNTLLSDIDQAEMSADQAQRSAAAALAAGHLPHPDDLSDIMDRHDLDRPWSEALRELGTELDAADQAGRVPQLAVHHGHAKVRAMKDEVALLNAYSPARTQALVFEPGALTPLETRPPQRRAPSGPRMEPRAFDRMLDGFLS